jgi:MFS family permease
VGGVLISPTSRSGRGFGLIPGLLRERGPFRIFWTGQSISLLGDQITFLAVPLLAVITLHANATDMGLLTSAAWLPYLLLALHAGAWVDRRGGRRRVMIVADIGRAVLLLTVPAAWALGILTLAQLYVVVFLAGTLSVFFQVSSASLFVTMVKRDRYLEGQALLTGTRAFSFLAGPSLSGILIQAFSAPIALAADALSFLVSALCLGRISPVEPPGAEREKGHLLGGVRFILGSPIMLASLRGTATLNLFQVAYGAISMLYLVRFLHLQPGTIGIVLGLGSIGGLVGSAFTGRLTRRLGVGPTYLLSFIVFPAPLLLVPIVGNQATPLILAILLVTQFGAAFGVMVLDTCAGTIFASLINDRLRSRVSGAYTVVNYGVRPVAGLLGGLLGTAIGLRSALILLAALATLSFVWLLPSPIPRMKALPETAAA